MSQKIGYNHSTIVDSLWFTTFKAKPTAVHQKLNGYRKKQMNIPAIQLENYNLGINSLFF